MNSRLDAVQDWDELARKAGYRADILAVRLDISPHQLRLYVIRRFGLSTKPWLEKLRQHDALSYLLSGKSIKEIAALLGFRHDTHFTRVFRREFGLTPTAYLHARTLDPPAMSENGRKSPKMVVDSARLPPGGIG